jgi:hypothetical protein
MMSNDRRVFVPLQKIDLPKVVRKQVREAEGGEIIKGENNEPPIARASAAAQSVGGKR